MPQSASAVLMVSTVGFGPDEQTAEDNSFQAAADDQSTDEIQRLAVGEFSSAVRALQAAGVEVHIFAGQDGLPDAVFPNNWFSTNEDGTLVLYPMKAESRRRERRPDLIDWLSRRYPLVIDHTHWEERGRYLEGTGSLVLDRENNIAFAARSMRTDEQLVRNWCADFEFEPVLFDTEGPGGKPVYHTNVLLAIGTGFAIVCSEVVPNPNPLVSALLSTDREVIEITRSQMSAFCGNVLELQGHQRIAVMSTTAKEAFQTSQWDALCRHVQPLVVSIPTIERYGGGGVRCMLAELF